MRGGIISHRTENFGGDGKVKSVKNIKLSMIYGCVDAI